MRCSDLSWNQYGRRGGQCYYEQGSPFLSHASSRCPTGRRPKASHTGDAGGQPQEEPPAGHLDRVWPDTGPTRKCVVAASGRPPRCADPPRGSVPEHGWAASTSTATRWSVGDAYRELAALAA